MLNNGFPLCLAHKPSAHPQGPDSCPFDFVWMALPPPTMGPPHWPLSPTHHTPFLLTAPMFFPPLFPTCSDLSLNAISSERSSKTLLIWVMTLWYTLPEPYFSPQRAYLSSLLYVSGSPTMVPKPASPGNSLRRQMLGPTWDLLNQKLSVLTNLSGDSDAH